MNDDMLELRMWRDGNIMHENCLEDMKKLKAERDEARRMYCLALSSEGLESPSNGVYDISVYNQAKLLAQEFGWDCYKENNNG